MANLEESDQLSAKGDTKIGKLGNEKVIQQPFSHRLELALASAYIKIQECTVLPGMMAGAFIGLSFLQIFAMENKTEIGNGVHDNKLIIPNSILDTLLLYPLLIGRVNYYIGVIGASLLILLYTILLSLIVYKKLGTASPKSVLVRLISFLSMLFMWVLFIPITAILAPALACTGDGQRMASEIVCYSLEHIILIAISYLFLALYILQIIAMSFFFQESNPYNKRNAFACFPSFFDLFFAFFRFAIIFIAIGEKDSAALQWIHFLCFMAGAIGVLIFYYEYCPYYNQYTSTIFAISAFSLTWVGFNFALGEIVLWAKVQYRGGFIAVILGIVFLCKVASSYHKARINSILVNMHLKDSPSEPEFSIYIHRLIYLVTNYQLLSPQDELIFEGFMAMHKDQCQAPDCPMNNPGKVYYLPLTRSKSVVNKVFNDPVRDRYIIIHLFTGINPHIQRSNYSNHARFLTSDDDSEAVCKKIVLALGYYYFHVIGNIHLAILQFTSLISSSSAINLRFAARSGLRAVEKAVYDERIVTQITLAKRTAKNFNPIKLLESEAKLQALMKEMGEIGKTYKEIYLMLLYPSPDMKKIMRMGATIVEGNQNIKDMWVSYNLDSKGKNKKAEIAYEQYIRNVRGEDDPAVIENEWKQKAAFMKKSSKGQGSDQAGSGDFACGDTKKDDDIFSLFDNENTVYANRVVIAMSAMPEKEGIIIKASKEIFNVFEYTPTELVGHNIEILMPEIIAKQHSSFVSRYLNTGESLAQTLSAGSHLTFAADKQQFIFKVDIRIKHYYESQHDSILVGLIGTFPKEEIILTDEQGQLVGISREASKVLGDLSPNFIKERPVKITDLFEFSNDDLIGTIFPNNPEYYLRMSFLSVLAIANFNPSRNQTLHQRASIIPPISPKNTYRTAKTPGFTEGGPNSYTMEVLIKYEGEDALQNKNNSSNINQNHLKDSPVLW